jgi:hypothetical protein
MKTCSVTGIRTKESNFYSNQGHLKAVDNFRRSSGVPTSAMKSLFNQLNAL